MGDEEDPDGATSDAPAVPTHRISYTFAHLLYYMLLPLLNAKLT
jgi:hypothetical protein